MRNDHWLRKRNGIWELKYPIQELISSSADLKEKTTTTASKFLKNKSKTDMYHETSDTENILNRLGKISGVNLNVEEGSCLDQLVLSGIVWPFAEIDTNRREYQLLPDMSSNENISDKTNKKYTISVVIDATSSGFMIGEVEILVSTPDEVPDAVTQIETIAEKLDFILAEKGGKVLNYLQQQFEAS